MADRDDDRRESTLGVIGRYVAEREQRNAEAALAYAVALVTDRATPEAVHGLCYEFAAAGIPYHRWPEMVMAAVEQGSATDLELTRARRDSLAMSLTDYGEADSVSPRQED